MSAAVLELAGLQQYMITTQGGGRDVSAWPRAHPWPGVVEQPPSWWTHLTGGWGCLRAHLGLWRHLAGADQPVLVLEDDAVPLAPLRPVTLPPRWDLLMLGGQHLVPPRVTGHLGVLRCRATVRTHAYVLAPGAGTRLRAALVEHDPRPLDRQLAVATRAGRIEVYAVKPWLVGQAAGLSLIDHVLREQRTWERA